MFEFEKPTPHDVEHSAKMGVAGAVMCFVLWLALLLFIGPPLHFRAVDVTVISAIAANGCSAAATLWSRNRRLARILNVVSWVATGAFVVAFVAVWF